MRRSRSAVQSWRFPAPTSSTRGVFQRLPDGVRSETPRRASRGTPCGRGRPQHRRRWRRRDRARRRRSSSSNTGTASRSASSSLVAPLADRHARRLVDRVHRQAISVVRIALVHPHDRGVQSLQPAPRKEPTMPVSHRASWQMCRGARGVRHRARRRRPRGSRGGQEAQFITQGDAARGLLAAARASGRGRARRRRRLRRVLLRRHRVGVGRRHRVRELGGLRALSGRRQHHQAAVLAPSTSSGRRAPTASSSGSSSGTRSSPPRAPTSRCAPACATDLATEDFRSCLPTRPSPCPWTP